MDPSDRIAAAIDLAEGALLGTEGRRRIWTDEDYLVAILACLTGDGNRAVGTAYRGRTHRKLPTRRRPWFNREARPR